MAARKKKNMSAGKSGFPLSRSSASSRCPAYDFLYERITQQETLTFSQRVCFLQLNSLSLPPQLSSALPPATQPALDGRDAPITSLWAALY
ncbi:hypothetical protein BaRGS_00003562 [Batillaria attramentaria]|uniref:Uncharacterized protein n=1 Tax=Batillaria attramentaria TaxID=370345 RepID=A0ABD0M0F8_9CAEN